MFLRDEVDFVGVLVLVILRRWKTTMSLTILERQLFSIGGNGVTALHLLTALGFLGVFWGISWILQRLMGRHIVSRFGIPPGAAYALKRILHYTLVFLGFVVALQTLGLNLTSLAVVLGFLSVGIGFGLQNITSNFISGIIILFERPVSVGDFVSIGDQSGTVLSINMRSTVIQTRDRVRLIVPNSRFVSEPVVNWTHGDTLVRLHAPVGVAYGSEPELVVQALLEAARSHPDVQADPAPEVRFMSFGDSALQFSLLAWTSRPDRQYLIGSQLNFLIYQKFREHNIKIPFPQRDIHLQMSPGVDVLSRLRTNEKMFPRG